MWKRRWRGKGVIGGGGGERGEGGGGGKGEDGGRLVVGTRFRIQNVFKLTKLSWLLESPSAPSSVGERKERK